ncbi:halovibrin HvnA [Pseudomonas sp. B21-051]|uniref:halovibrin HvnA n=1 Tax=Pseudomonas sp. B21-051 TaxID=2895491 RepID=UPI00215EF33E|nr:halovibrin HvnA [Pseudomonas sp. B21-051]UVK87778.1 halovibrin HvnA [Pseudomonas sp. B21-051]
MHLGADLFGQTPIEGHEMKKLLLPLLISVLVGCSSQSTSEQNSSVDNNIAAVSAVQSMATQSTGPELAAELTRRYRDTRVNCGKDSMPAFLCSGILLRGTARAAGFDVWDPSPTAIRVGGTSFSYVRSDYKMQRLAFTYNKGLIFYPILSLPAGKEKIDVLCFFPIDGSSDLRTSNGCGEIAGNPGTVACAAQNIRTGEQWAANYLKYAPTSHNYLGVCSFDVRDAANNLAGPNFYQGMIGGRAISPRTFQTPNDVKLKTWAPGLAKTLPIQAFFYYVRDGKAGLVDVQIDQHRFKELTGISIPIIKITFPKTLDESMTFVYQAADQTN